MTRARHLTLPSGRFDLGSAPRIMGILNVTPDSFSDGGEAADFGAAVEKGLRLIDDGADILDVGGESTRPGADPVPAEEELRRVLPVIRDLARQTTRPVSIDTSKAVVAGRALEAGAQMVNDVSALDDPEMAHQVADGGAALVLMHRRGNAKTMQLDPRYEDVLAEILAFLDERATLAQERGVAWNRLVVDPGIGFGKRLEDNIALFRNLDRFHELELPLLLGASRKSFLGQILAESDPARRLEGSLAAAARAVDHGVQILRVHDVAATRRFLAAYLPLGGAPDPTHAEAGAS